MQSNSAFENLEYARTSRDSRDFFLNAANEANEKARVLLEDQMQMAYQLEPYGDQLFDSVKAELLADPSIAVDYRRALEPLHLHDTPAFEAWKAAAASDNQKDHELIVSSGSGDTLHILSITATPITADGSYLNWKFVIAGHHLGQRPAYEGTTEQLRLVDVTSGGWVAGTSGCTVGLKVSKWTDNEVVIEQYTGAYGPSMYVARPGDVIRVSVSNPTTGVHAKDYDVKLESSSHDVATQQQVIQQPNVSQKAASDADDPKIYAVIKDYLSHALSADGFSDQQDALQAAGHLEDALQANKACIKNLEDAKSDLQRLGSFPNNHIQAVLKDLLSRPNIDDGVKAKLRDLLD